jgi:hypothetical protein
MSFRVVSDLANPTLVLLLRLLQLLQHESGELKGS